MCFNILCELINGFQDIFLSVILLDDTFSLEKFNCICQIYQSYYNENIKIRKKKINPISLSKYYRYYKKNGGNDYYLNWLMNHSNFIKLIDKINKSKTKLINYKINIALDTDILEMIYEIIILNYGIKNFNKINSFEEHYLDSKYYEDLFNQNNLIITDYPKIEQNFNNISNIINFTKKSRYLNIYLSVNRDYKIFNKYLNLLNSIEHIQKLCINYINISDSEIKKLANLLPKLKNLNKLEITEGILTDTNIGFFVDKLPLNLEILNISGNNIIEKINTLPLFVHSNILELNLNDLEIYQFEYIIDTLNITKKLEKLYLSSSLFFSHFNEETEIKLIEFKLPDNLKVLDVSWNTDVDNWLICLFLEKIPITIEELYLANNYVGTQDSNILINKIHLYKNLKKLDFSMNLLSLSNLKKIFNKITSKIEFLDLSGNINDYFKKNYEYTIISKNLPRLKNLKYLNLKSNNINDYNAKLIIEGLSKTKSFPIELLDLRFNLLTPRTLKLINMIYLNKQKLLNDKNRDFRVLISNNKFNKNIFKKYSNNIFD